MTEAQCKAVRGRIDVVYHQVTEDIALLVSQGILTKIEARQILGVDPPDADPPAVQVTIHTHPGVTERDILNAASREVRRSLGGRIG